MVMYWRLTLVVTLGCLLLCSLVPHCAASGIVEGQTDANTGVFSAGSRRLLQNTIPCNHSFAFDNFTNLENACPPLVNVSDTSNYPKSACCNALAVMICPYAAIFTDENTQCSHDFFNIWSLVEPTYPNNFFGFICTNVSSPQGLMCPNAAPPPSGHDMGNFSPSLGLQSLGLTLLWALAILELLVLCF